MNAQLSNFLKTIDPDFLNSAEHASDDIVSPEALKRSHSMTVALLKHAHALINDAEAKIGEQETRIKSLENLAVTDELTSLLNRRGFENAVRRELQRLQRQQLRGGAFALMDLDAFKPINDTYGHHAGDLCLKAVADCLTEMTRTTDVVARLGGDEFSIYISNISPEKAATKIKKINDALNKITVDWNGHKISVKASIGYIMVTYPAKPYEEIYNDADQHMYKIKTKRKGRKTQRSKILNDTDV